MSEPSLIEREVGVLESLNENARRRAAGESKLTGDLALRGATIESEYRSARRTLEQKAAQAIQKVKSDGEAEVSGIRSKAKSAQAQTQAEYDAATKAYKQKFAGETAKARKLADDAKWNSSAVYDSGKGEVKKYYEAMTRSLANDEQTREALDTEATGLLKKYGKFIKADAPVELAALPSATEAPEEKAPEPGDEYMPKVEKAPAIITDYHASLQFVDQYLVEFHKLGAIKALQPGAFAFVAIMLVAAPAVVGGFAAGWTVGAIGGAVGGLVLAAGLYVALSAVAKKGATRVGAPLKAEVGRMNRLAEEAKAWLEADHEARKTAVEARRENELRRADEELAKRTAGAEERLGAEKARVEALYPPGD